MFCCSELLINKKNIKIFKEESEKAMKLAKKLNVKLSYLNSFDCISEPFEKEKDEPEDLVQITLAKKGKDEPEDSIQTDIVNYP